MKKYDILSVKDQNHKKVIKKDKIFDLPMRLLLNAKTGQGKGVLITNYLLRDEYYNNDFVGENIYIFNPTMTETKNKILIKQKRIPNENLFENLDEDSLGAVLEFIQEQYLDAIQNKEKPRHSLIIIDDCAPSLKNKRNGAIQNAFIRGRHFLCSVIVTTQYYNKLPPVCRNNLSGLVSFETNLKQLESISDDHNYLKGGMKSFKNMFYNTTCKTKHSTFVVNYTNDKQNRYMDGNFESLDQSDYEC